MNRSKKQKQTIEIQRRSGLTQENLLQMNRYKKREKIQWRKVISTKSEKKKLRNAEIQEMREREDRRSRVCVCVSEREEFTFKQKPRNKKEESERKRNRYCIATFHILKTLSVVYFDQRLGAAHSKRWLKYAFSTFFCLKAVF